MKIPLSWMKELLPVTLSVTNLARGLTMLGMEVASIQGPGSGWNPSTVLVGLVTGVEPHPNADRLNLVTVNLGSENVKVVCGAPNIAIGQRVAFAKEGSLLFNVHSGKREILKKANIRGVPSAGMVCSAKELELGEDHTGILVLSNDAPVGVSLSDYLGDVILDLNVTPNRPDCLSIRGIAHEVAAFTGILMNEPSLSYPENGEPVESLCHIEISDRSLCHRYTATIVDGVAIKPSPKWMQKRLAQAGVRSINNIVDITNYVMLEYGQPLHAFDFEAISGQVVKVRAAFPNERLVTLDGVDHTLQPPMLVIADANRPIGLAGIMGGSNSEMTERTTTVLLESASFQAVNTRRTSQALGIRTEASLRFEKGLSSELAIRGLKRATQLILELAGGTAAHGVIDLYPGQEEMPPILLTKEKVQRVLGMGLSINEITRPLKNLGFSIQNKKRNSINVSPPYWRSDVTIPEELVEEVARVIGYDEIPTAQIAGPIPSWEPRPAQELQEKVRDLLVSLGLQEITSYSLVSLDFLNKVGAARQATKLLRVTNPMSTSQQYLRPTLRASVLSTLASNLRHPRGGIRIFEVGKIYLPQLKSLPDERSILAAAFAGQQEEASWIQGSPAQLDFYEAKRIAYSVLKGLELGVSFKPLVDDFMLHPGRSASIHAFDDTRLGVVGELHPEIARGFELTTIPVAYFEIDLETLLRTLPSEPKRYQSIPKFPGAIRDLALIVGRATAAGQVVECIQSHNLVAQATLFDVYEGKGIPVGKKSLAISVLFQSTGHTLTSPEVSAAQDEILAYLGKKFDCTLRS